MGGSTGPSKVAVVSGAARGIGAATALRLAKDGMAVAVLDLDEERCARTTETIAASGGQALAVAADITVSSQVEAAYKRISTELGPPTVLVNNAGAIRDRPFEDMTEDDWDTIVDINLRGTFLMTRAIRPYQVERGWGRVVNLSSAAAAGNRNQTNYSAAKAGIEGLTKTLAIELGAFGITVNAVAPGFIVTDMTAGTAERQGMDFERYQRMVAMQTPVRRVGRPEDVAGAVAFLVGDEAGYISGEVLHVTGGPLR